MSPTVRLAALSVISILAMIGGIFPAISNAFWPFDKSESSEGTGGGRRENIQTMQLPIPSLGRGVGGIGGGTIEVVDESALVPQEGPSGTPIEIEDNAKSSHISVYVVRSGDNLSSIAKLFDVSVNTIMWANDISNARSIRPGQTLVILPVTGIRYTVKKGGSLRDIVKKYGGDLEEATRYNGVDPDENLAEGTVVVIPDGELEAPRPTTPSSGTRTVRGASGPTFVGYYLHPVSGARKTQGLHGYNGIDFGAPSGTNVLASASGDVIISRSGGWNGGYGVYIVVKHDNGTQTLYAHLSNTRVVTGEHVAQGQPIGAVGSTGRSTGTHLHFEVRGAKNPF